VTSSASRPTLRIRTLGGLSIALDDAPLPADVRAKALALLCYLAVTGRPQPREALLGLLWEGMDEAEAQANLRQLLAQLRRHVDPWLVVSRADIAFDRTQPHWLDVEHIAEETLGTMSHQGVFLLGFSVRNAPAFEEWVTGQRARFGEVIAQTLHRMAIRHSLAGDDAAAIQALNQLMAIDPWHEEAHREKMLLLSRAGKYSAALAQYAACKVMLQRELGSAPTRETAILAERITRAQNRRAAPLPGYGTEFVGRVAELNDLTRRLSRGSTRLATLLAPGGMGKTRLAIEAARLLQTWFMEGVWFIPLREAQNDAQVFPRMLQSLGLGPERAPLEALIDYARDKHLLLVLDNAEHALSIGPDLARLLSAAPDLRLLVTSREPLRISWEELVPLAGLARSIDPNTIGDAEQLLLAGTRRQHPDQTAPTQDLAAARRISELVEGVPLALELAASMAARATLPRIAEILEQDLRGLTSTMRDAAEQHASLRAVFDQSWALLGEEERLSARRLSVFEGEFGTDAALAVGGVPESMLWALAGRSFLRAAGASGEDQRFAMHAVLRAFAREALHAAGESDALADRHAEYFCEAIGQDCDALVGARQQTTVAGYLRDDVNLAQAWDWAVHREHSRLLERMLPGVDRYSQALSRAAQWLPRYEAALASADPDGKLAHLLLAYVAANLRLTGDYVGAREKAQRAVAWFGAHDHPAELAHARLVLGNAHLVQGQMAEARACYAAALAADDGFVIDCAITNLALAEMRMGEHASAEARIRPQIARARAQGDVLSEAIATLNLAVCLNYAGNMAECELRLRDAEQLFGRTGDRIGQAMTTGNIGDLLIDRGQFDDAAPFFTRALEIYRDVGHRHKIANMLGKLGRVALLRGNLDEADQLLSECQAIALALGANDLIATHQQTMADALFQRGDKEAGWAALRNALRAAITREERRDMEECLLRFARSHARFGPAALAARILQTLLAQAKLPAALRLECASLLDSLPAAIGAASPPPAVDALAGELLAR
jgi:predicted ATPase/DNA-binding SARP family transcriptional activator